MIKDGEITDIPSGHGYASNFTFNTKYNFVIIESSILFYEIYFFKAHFLHLMDLFALFTCTSINIFQ